MSDTSATKSGPPGGDNEPRSPSLWERLWRWGGLSDGGESGDGSALADGMEPLDKHERILIQNVLRLRELTAWDVMVPRVDIVGIDIAAPFTALVSLMVEEGHSRLPVYRDDLDHIVGMVHVKDVLGFIATNNTTTIAAIMRKILPVAPTARVLDLLTQMRTQRVHMAFVVDEFGGIDGLITIEDLVEEIVGEIEDEHDDASSPYIVTRPDGTLIADARTPIEELEKLLGLQLLTEETAEEVDTIGGLCFMLVGRVPARGEIIEHPRGLTFEILEADQRRIRRLRIRRTAPTGGSGNAV